MPYTLANPARNRTVGLCIEKGWALVMTCSAGHSARWNVERLAEDFDRAVTLEAIAERLRCKVCGSVEGTLSTRQDLAVTQAREIAQYEASGRK